MDIWWQNLVKQTNDFRETHTGAETAWMLDSKVISAASVLMDAFRNRSNVAISVLKNCNSPAMIMEECYHILIRRKAIVPIKDMDIEFRKGLIELTKELFGEGIETKKFYRLSKALYVFSFDVIEIKKTW